MSDFQSNILDHNEVIFTKVDLKDRHFIIILLVVIFFTLFLLATWISSADQSLLWVMVAWVSLFVLAFLVLINTKIIIGEDYVKFKHPLRTKTLTFHEVQSIGVMMFYYNGAQEMLLEEELGEKKWFGQKMVFLSNNPNFSSGKIINSGSHIMFHYRKDVYEFLMKRIMDKYSD